jgi:hypothetical protein
MRLDQVKHPTGEPDERECPDAAGDRGFVAFIDFLVFLRATAGRSNGKGISLCKASLSRLRCCAASAAEILPQIDVSGHPRQFVLAAEAMG